MSEVTSANFHKGTEVERTREILTRALASESRNALARIELAASEIARFENSPSLQARLVAIHAAVGEIDSLLGKIDLLSDVRPMTAHEPIELGTAAMGILERLAPVLATRGVLFELSALSVSTQETPHEESPQANVALPLAVIESLVIGLARLASSALDGPRVLEVRLEVKDEVAALWFRCDGQTDLADRIRINREPRLELEVELVERGGCLIVDPVRKAHEIAFTLPLSGSAGERVTHV